MGYFVNRGLSDIGGIFFPWF